MYINTGYATSPSFGLALSNLLLALHATSPIDSINKVCSDMGWGTDGQWNFTPSERDIPRFGFCATTRQIVVLISGTDDARQVQHYVLGAAGGEITHDAGTAGSSFNFAFVNWGIEAAKRCKAAGAANREVLLVGHSYGGAVAMECLLHMRLYGWCRGDSIAITFGQPKLGDAAHQHVLQTSRCLRWVNAGDPVPTLPPTEGEIGAPISITRKIALLVGLKGLYVPGPGGRTLLPSGHVEVSNDPGTITPTLVGSLPGIFRPDRDFVLPQQHLLTSYRDALAWSATITEGGIERPQFVRPPARRPAGNLDLATQLAIKRFQARNGGLFQDVRIRPLVVVDTRRAPNPLPPGARTVANYVSFPTAHKAKPVRIAADRYMVYWEERPIFGPVPASNAKAFVRKLNWLLGRVGNVGALDVTLFTASLRDFATAAQTGGEGWSPNPWNISIS